MSAFLDEPGDFVLENARLVLADRVLDHGWVAVADGAIAAVGEGRAPERGFDLGQDYLLPGLVELHTDHLEGHFLPRPQVRWNALSAVTAYDAQMAAAGITTVFDSLRVGSDGDAAAAGADLTTLAEALGAAARMGHLRVDHRTHLRCEIAAPDPVRQTTDFVGRFPVHLMSLMDHTPGQRQFRDLDIWRRYYLRKTARTEAEIAAFVERRIAFHGRFAKAHRDDLVAIAKRVGAVLASHDDTTADHVALSVADGVALAEFPTSLAAAEACRKAGVAVMAGAPNIVRGSSHSGNVAARTLAENGLLDILSSDYIPASLLFAAFLLPRLVPDLALPDAVRMVTAAPAAVTGLTDRGVLVAGRRADLIRVAMAGDTPIVRRVWSKGRLAA